MAMAAGRGPCPAASSIIREGGECMHGNQSINHLIASNHAAREGDGKGQINSTVMA